METLDVVTAVADPMGSAGAAFYFHPDTLATGKELGLDGFRFYMLGRAAVMGDVPPSVVESAFGYFSSGLVSKIYGSAKERVAPADAAAAYWNAAADIGRKKLADVAGLDAYCQAAEKVVVAARPAGLPLFAGISSMPLADDLPGRALQLTAVLRELRGSVHLVAIVAAGLDNAVAHAIRRPDDVATFGHEAAPGITDADRALLAEADEATNRMMCEHYGVLDAAESQAIVDGATAIASAVAA
jgi:Helix-turn-helix family